MSRDERRTPMNNNHRSGLPFLTLAVSLLVYPAANAIIGVAPGGSVVRRHAIVAVAATESAAASSAAASQAQAQQAQAQAAAATAQAQQAQAQAAQAQAQAHQAQAAAVVIGTTATALPSGCISQTAAGGSYFQCGSTWYQPSFKGTNLVYVVVAAPK
jgi:endonuclease/exonuclease/phosphatase (EEP) superfamily protein YafD